MNPLIEDDQLFWVAHVRGPNYDQLRKKGFLVLYPDVDDYVFLEVKKDNEKYLKRQLELAIAFLKNKKGYQTVRYSEVKRMMETTSAERIEIGARVSAISGYCDGLEGIVKGVTDDKIIAVVQGYNRTYEVELDRLDVIVKADEELT